MQEIILTRGLPGSGKTTWAKQQNATRVSRDDLRFQMYGSYSSESIDEDLISEVEEAAVRAALRAGNTVVVDAMHLQQRYINRWQRLGYPVRVVEFEAPLYQLLAQNQQRDKVVPDAVINQLFKKYTDGDLGTLRKVRVEPEKYMVDYRYRPNRMGRNAFIFDIDGTLSNNDGHRSFYDYTKVEGDSLHTEVATVARALQKYGYAIVIVSGREASCYDDTKQWLDDNYIPYSRLIMREAGDHRPDMVVKAEILRDEVAPHYNVLGVFDDRPSVCEMWRKVGLPTFQVGDPENRF